MKSTSGAIVAFCWKCDTLPPRDAAISSSQFPCSSPARGTNISEPDPLISGKTAWLSGMCSHLRAENPKRNLRHERRRPPLGSRRRPRRAFGDSVGETTAHGPMTISQIVNTTEKSTKPAPSRMRSQRFHKRSRRCHSARVTFIGAQLTAAMKRGLRCEPS